MNATAIVSIIIGLIGVGGIGGAIVALAKLRPEAGQIVVQTAQGAVIVQSGVIDSLTEELERMKVAYDNLTIRYEELTTRFAELTRTTNTGRLKARVADLEDQRTRLTRRVGELETQNLQLREELDVVKEQTNGNGHTETNGGPSGRG